MRRVILGMMVAACMVAGPAATPVGAATAVPCTTPSDPHRVPYKSPTKQYRHSKVWIYGDSITYQSFRAYRSTVDYRVAVDAQWGRNTAMAVSALGADVHRLYDHLPDVVVVATGTNDLYQLNQFAHQVHLARAVLPSRVRLVWVNVFVTTTNLYNAADRVLTAAPGVEVLSWSSVARDQSMLLDGIHVNARGCAARNALIRRHLR